MQQQGVGGNSEALLDQVEGPIVSTIAIQTGKAADIKNDWTEVVAPLQETKGKHDVFLVFSNEKESQKDLFNIDWLYFSNKYNQ